jgi:hypothetical protein
MFRVDLASTAAQSRNVAVGARGGKGQKWILRRVSGLDKRVEAGKAM